MAELIDKGALMKDIVGRFGCRPYIEVGNKCEYVHTILDEQPTVTEAEIRAKAIDEFAEKMKAKCNVGGVFVGCEVRRMIEKLAEQLKERE